eukprot:CAMPEP_0201558596 /NCGR_PEP_ID=MMETSP0173_2-20130828/68755_1 /ASSEMBLY_ACC=CAM_ASM_000268 /TAXON_ID=218659 /ORGANISM="Vexillifera sp., Strain DIVA3 564/2" /LENGTH=448 /DNA_ID=CAMNT_0047972077 /DNA_START=65 /DNA_END=1408 /DNA_ORIENTATION=-
MHFQILARLLRIFSVATPPPSNTKQYLLLQGASIQNQQGTDTELSFLQESNFYYVSGVVEPDCVVIIDVAHHETHLFVPRLDSIYAVWNGYVLSLEDYQKKYGADFVYYTDQYADIVKAMTANNIESIFYTLPGVTFSSIQLPNNSPTLHYNDDASVLLSALYQSRAVKVEGEIALLKIASQISAEAHNQVMRVTEPGLYEFQIEAEFEHYNSVCALQYQSYLPIVGSGYNAAILHYIENTSEMKNGDLLLIDAAGSYRGYTSDITRTFPVNGRFSQQQRQIYSIVLRVQQNAISEMVVGAQFSQISKNASLLMLELLTDANFVCCASPLELYELRIDKLFQNHGLGHFVGLSVHDTTVYPTGPLEPNMFLTIEPGIYFNEALFGPALCSPTQSKYLNTTLIQSFLDQKFGGVRIEDVIMVTESGPKVISAASPTSINEIEHIMKSLH